MIAFGLIIGLIAFLMFLAYSWQKHQRNEMTDDENYVEPELEESESQEDNNI